MNVGKITDARDQVLTTFFSLRLFISSMRPRSRASTNGPFLTERDIYSLPPRLLAMSRADDEASGGLGPPGAVAHRGRAPRRLGRHAGRGLAFATTVRMVARVHHHATHLGPLAHVARAPCLAKVLVLVIEVADLPDGRHASHRDAAHLARWHPDRGIATFLRQQLGGRSGGPDDLTTLAGGQLDVVDRGAERDVRQRQRVAHAGFRLRPRHDDIADAEAVRQQHVALLTIAVMEQTDPRGAVRVVLDRRDARRHAGLVALEVDAAVVLLLTAAAVADGHAALVVPPGAALLPFEQRLVRLLGGDLLEGRASHLPEAGRGRLVTAKRHRQTPSKNSIFWPGASVTMAFFQGVV